MFLTHLDAFVHNDLYCGVVGDVSSIHIKQIFLKSVLKEICKLYFCLESLVWFFPPCFIFIFRSTRRKSESESVLLCLIKKKKIIKMSA